MSTAAPDERRRELAQIHIAKKQLALDDDTYRAVLWSIGRVKSSADLGAQGRRQVLDHLRACGFVPTRNVSRKTKQAGDANARADWAWVNNASPERRPLLRKLAMMLKEAGRGRPYLDGVAKQMYGIEKVEFCAPDQLRRIVAALSIDQKRRAEKAEA